MSTDPSKILCAVADGVGRGERCFDVARLDERATAVGVMRPYAGETVGLQFDAHRYAVVLGGAQARAQLFRFARDADLFLHMVADFMRDYVGACEVAASMKAPCHFIEESEIEINLLVARAVERTHCRLPAAAGSGCGTAKQHQRRRLVLCVVAREQFAPGIFRLGEDFFHLADPAALVIGGRIDATRTTLRCVLAGAVLHGLDQPQQRTWIDTEKIAGD